MLFCILKIEILNDAWGSIETVLNGCAIHVFGSTLKRLDDLNKGERSYDTFGADKKCHQVVI